ncbi:MAG: hypothetical protein HQ490_04335 [Lutibacter sp.]|nr:hypothetical protein [Lutibacter sp.]
MSDISYARHVVYCYLVENRLEKNGEILKKKQITTITMEGNTDESVNPLRPLIEILDEKEYLFKKYCDILDCDKNMISGLRKEFNAMLLLRVEHMPYWLVLELICMGFNMMEDEYNDDDLF